MWGLKEMRGMMEMRGTRATGEMRVNENNEGKEGA